MTSTGEQIIDRRKVTVNSTDIMRVRGDQLAEHDVGVADLSS
ncbi:hypothetical protein ABZ345_17820 [Lentzea sp. NPDC005914]